MDCALKTAGLVMYLAEGTKGNGSRRYKNGPIRPLGRIEITNSNPMFISLFLRFLREYYYINEERLRARISIHEIQLERLREIEEFWSKVTGIPLRKFNKSVIRKTVYKNLPKRKPAEYSILQPRYNGRKLVSNILSEISTLTSSLLK